MLRFVWKGLRTGIVTTSYPDNPDPAPEGFRGLPELDPAKCGEADFRRYEAICPSNAMIYTGNSFEIHYGRCVFCGLCQEVGPQGGIRQSREYELASRTKEDLVLNVNLGSEPTAGDLSDQGLEQVGGEVQKRISRLFGRSLHIREIDSGSCNACEWEITALTNPVYDIQRFGIDFVASPRFADMLLVTGPVTRNMEVAVRKTYEATPEPKLVVAVGACACDGGVFRESYATAGGLDRILPVDAYIPGCPPRPQALLHGILLVLDRCSQRIERGRIVSRQGGGA